MSKSKLRKELDKILADMPKDMVVSLTPGEYGKLQKALDGKAVLKVTAVPIKKLNSDWSKFKKVQQAKGTLWDQFKDSKILKPILEKWLHVKPRKTKLCECGRVEYKQVSSLALKQVNIIQDLSEAIAYLERDREEIKDNALQELDKLKTSNLESLEKVRILEDVNEELREEIEQLTKRLEVMKHVN
ncbi:hypothetical protein [Candidatus Pelagibacter sp. HIMB1709]|uniref:hypothetical protein n=1 Tax=Candidatus Pelagibacter sp. HIMB1709 TaxID=3413367 RepID=UPI003F83C1D0